MVKFLNSLAVTYRSTCTSQLVQRGKQLLHSVSFIRPATSLISLLVMNNQFENSIVHLDRGNDFCDTNIEDIVKPLLLDCKTFEGSSRFGNFLTELCSTHSQGRPAVCKLLLENLADFLFPLPILREISNIFAFANSTEIESLIEELVQLVANNDSLRLPVLCVMAELPIHRDVSTNVVAGFAQKALISADFCDYAVLLQIFLKLPTSNTDSMVLLWRQKVRNNWI